MKLMEESKKSEAGESLRATSTILYLLTTSAKYCSKQQNPIKNDEGITWFFPVSRKKLTLGYNSDLQTVLLSTLILILKICIPQLFPHVVWHQKHGVLSICTSCGTCLQALNVSFGKLKQSIKKSFRSRALPFLFAGSASSFPSRILRFSFWSCAKCTHEWINSIPSLTSFISQTYTSISQSNPADDL